MSNMSIEMFHRKNPVAWEFKPGVYLKIKDTWNGYISYKNVLACKKPQYWMETSVVGDIESKVL